MSLNYGSFSISVNGEATRVSHPFVKKNIVRYMRLHGQFVHCLCGNEVFVPHFHTCGARTACFIFLYRNILLYCRKTMKYGNSIFRYKRPKRAVGALHFYTSSERIARVASCIEPYFSLQIHANPSWLTVHRHRKCAVTNNR